MQPPTSCVVLQVLPAGSRPWSVTQRAAAIVRNGAKLLAVGFWRLHVRCVDNERHRGSAAAPTVALLESISTKLTPAMSAELVAPHSGTTQNSFPFLA